MIFILTSDVDFVSDDFLRIAYQPLEQLPMTIFMTGASTYLSESSLTNTVWEMEPHPNFCEGSTHGSSIDEVFHTIRGFSGEERGFRCHRYYSSNDIEERFAGCGYSYASNICADLVYVPPFINRCGLLQIPIFFEDGGYLKYHGVPTIDDIAKRLSHEGVYVFNFHPIHLALNSCDFSSIRRLKDSMSQEQYHTMTEVDVQAHRNIKYGMMNFLQDLLLYAREHNVRFMNLKQYDEEYKTLCI